MKACARSAAFLSQTTPVAPLVFAALLVQATSAFPAGAGEAAEVRPALEIAGVRVEPPNPGPATLCRLSVDIHNPGEETASSLFFRVLINDQIVPVYENHVFMQAIPAGSTETIRLYNFWSTETHRPLPANGKLRVEVILREARWTEIAMEEEVEVWKPVGEVEGLPTARSVTLDMQND